MSDIEKTIKILEKVPKNISSKITMQDISDILSIMFSIHDEKAFVPTVDDFIEAFEIKVSIDEGLDDIKNGRTYTTEELKKELNLC